MEIVNRCVGQCCARFYVSVDVLTDPARDVEDCEYIADMLIPLEEVPGEGPPGQWACTCRHFDGRNCTAYEQRPRMCRDYPYGRTCVYQGCQLVQLEPAPPVKAEP